MTLQPTNRKIVVPLWILSLLLGLATATIGWAALDRLKLEGEKAELRVLVQELNNRLGRVEERVNQIYELNYRRADR